jgi:pimeloyl-ACP methyl ester carboxylesterase
VPIVAGINIVESGERAVAPPLLLIHGSGGSLFEWPAELRQLPGSRVIAIDLPGHGGSPPPPCDSVPEFAAVVAGLLEALEITRAILVGHSLGGAVAVLAAARWFDGHTTASGSIYTFGAPRVGDADFCKSIRFPLWRVIDNTDIVPLVPTGAYAEAGGMKWIDERGALRDEWNPQSVGIGSNMRFLFSNWRRGRWVWIPRDVVDHSPLYYAIYLYNRGVDEVE